MRDWKALLIALLAGAALPFAFAPWYLWPVAFVSPMVLFVLLQGMSPVVARKTGFLFGLGFFGHGVHWIYFSLHLFGAAIAPLAAFMTLLFVAVLSLFPLFVCHCYAVLTSRLNVCHQPYSVVAALLFTTLWILFEWIRGWLFGGFPWLLVGYSQTPSWFGRYAPVFGVYGVSVAVVLISTLVVNVAASRDVLQRIVSGLIAAALVLASAILSSVSWSTPVEGEPLAVRLIQGNIPQSMKFTTGRLRSSLETYTAMTLEAPAQTDIVIWPETAIPTYFNRVEDYLAPFLAETDARGMDVLSGGFSVDDEDRVYNSFRQLSGERQLYRKQHLVPFGEFMPFRFVLDYVAQFIQIPMSDLTPGPDPIQPMNIKGHALGISICFEDAFGEEMARLLPASSALVNVSNDAWFGDSAAPYQHQQIAAMRAIEFARPMLRVTNTGVSSYIDYQGQVQSTIGFEITGSLDVTVQPMQGRTPYMRWGNAPVIVLMLIVAVALLGAGWRQRATVNRAS